MLIRSNKKHRGNAYLSDPVGVDKEGNELTLMDLLFEKEEGVFKTVESRLVHEKFMRLLEATLCEREFTVLCLRYGLKGGAPMPQREVAAFLHISRSYVSRIEKRAIERVRAHLDRERLSVSEPISAWEGHGRPCVGAPLSRNGGCFRFARLLVFCMGRAARARGGPRRFTRPRVASSKRSAILRRRPLPPRRCEKQT